MTSNRVTEFVGVSAEPRRGVLAGVGPYEFFTEQGVRVALHDADFLGLVWLPSATTRFYFIYDLEWTPVEATATPVIELTFCNVQVLRWESDLDALGDPRRYGQMSAFAWDGADRFDLSTFTFNLSFRAVRMEAQLVGTVPSSLSEQP